ncbi:High mobility group protein 20A like [Verticillium longisporum]|nr:High mobility group protein 20A like [Verticillium longisporum]
MACSDALGVKLGHRRKLQRRIANSRGLAPDASLVSPIRASVEDTRTENTKPEPIKPDSKDVAVVTKRKYRRHPKPDENAPERPPSAYVLFSNKMRDDLKGRNLTFTEIAKLRRRKESTDHKRAPTLSVQSACMAQGLGTIFAELGILQYLDTFVEQGFDTWATILDITESDLDALGVKLGHRRKLQRRIANSRGLAPDASLVSRIRASVEDTRTENTKPEPIKQDSKDVAVVTKRKYRRHPKPDENAPERPPSAYVLFSNKMRDDLKGRNLTFTEIAKLVGENWQSLSPVEKEPFETQALNAKEKYNQDLAEYKKTYDYKKYAQYLHDFKQKQLHQNQAAKNGTKRLKLDANATRVHQGSSASVTPGGSGTGSGSDSVMASDGSTTRKDRPARRDVFSATHAPGPGAMGVITDQRGPPPLVKYSSSGSSGATDASTTSSRTSISVHEGAIDPAKADPNLDGMKRRMDSSQKCRGEMFDEVDGGDGKWTDRNLRSRRHGSDTNADPFKQ